jgi:glycopeptide antibiotics resistance protein
VFRIASFIPFGIHFLMVWVPLVKAQERPLLPETPFA